MSKGEGSPTATDRAKIEDIYPLSPMQSGMLFHSIAEPDAGMYIVQLSQALQGTLDEDACKRAWDDVVARHPALRTSFAWQSLDEPRQVVHKRVELPWHEEDLSHLPAAAQRDAVLAYLVADRKRGFDLARAPLMRFAIFRLADDRFHFVWSRHHLLLDGWSTPIVMQEFSALYDGRRRGQPAVLPPATPYRAYIAWLAKQDTKRAEARWREVLRGFRAPTPIGIDRGGLGEGANDYERQRFDFAPGLCDELTSLARRHGLTLNTLVQGAWALLLSSYADAREVLFGATVSGRPPELPGVEGIVGVTLNTLPVRVKVPREGSLLAWLKVLHAGQLELRDLEHTPLSDVQKWSEVPRGVPLFESLLIFENFPRGALGPAAPEEQREITFGDATGAERTNYPLTIYVLPDRWVAFDYEVRRFERAAITRMMDAFRTVLESIARDVDQPLARVQLMPLAERTQLLEAWNDTRAAYPSSETVVAQLEAQVLRTPGAVAATFGARSLTYAELDRRANQLARVLRAAGVGPESLVGLCVDRSLELLVGLLGILKAGGAYVPLDPGYPRERLGYMIADSGMRVVVAGRLQRDLVPDTTTRVFIDDPALASEPDGPLASSGLAAEHLAYVIYTSGSTGRPKGTMVSHRNVVSFFSAMDARIPVGAGERVWCAVTSMSFDISVLELLWTLTRGFHVVVQQTLSTAMTASAEVGGSARSPRRKVDFGLFYFASEAVGQEADRYRLLLDGARFADRHGFKAVWTPERHFHAFGGLYPSPAVMGAALAAITEHVHIRAGSVVAPLHSPVRIAEEWSLVDNLSKGRVGVSFASGWHADDFVFAPERYERRRELTSEAIDIVRALWRGDAVTLPGGAGTPVSVRTLPRPIQSELPIWLTASGTAATFERAGTMGTHLLTHLLGQTVEELAEKVRVYREAWRRAGHPGEGTVSLMIHTFVGADTAHVREIVRAPFMAYLKSSADLIQGAGRSRGGEAEAEVTAEDLDDIAAQAFERYFETSALFGSHERCLAMVEKLTAAGVDELACLIDFGVDTDQVLDMLEHLDAVRAAAQADPEEVSLVGQLVRHKVTHLQCTPSLARLFTLEPEALEALGGLRVLMLGGEGLPRALAQDLSKHLTGDLLNMYGPTETTIWSATHQVDRAAFSAQGPTISLGTPIANTRCYVLDAEGRLAPAGALGELYIGGAGVVRGYLARPELTAERFVVDPYDPTPGARMYKTGDVVRQRVDGSIDFIGRADFQVKIRGVRIELGEIDAALTSHAGVAEAVVIAREDVPGEHRLVGYVVPRRPAPDVASLRSHLKTRLPDVMVPTAWVFLDALPLTPNGKVDRNALVAPEGVVESARPYEGPRNDVEAALAEIWSKIFRVEKVSVHDNFFELGGDSITTVHIVARARKARLLVMPRQLFSHQTIAELATVISSVGGARPEGDTEWKGQVPLTTWQRELLRTPDVRAHVLRLELAPELERRVLLEALRLLRERHEALRLRLWRDGDAWRQELDGRVEPGADSLVIVPAARSGPAEIDAAIRRSEQALMDGEARGLVGCLVESAARGARAELILVLDARVLDDRSVDLLLDELAAVAEALRRGAAPAPASGPSFHAWAATQSVAGTRGERSREAELWLESAAPGSGRLASVGEPGDASATRVVVERVLPDVETATLVDRAIKVYGMELQEFLTAALVQALRHQTGDRVWRLALASDGRASTRDGEDLSRSLGQFRTRYPVRLTASSRGPAEELKTVKEALRRVPLGGTGYGILLDSERDGVRHALVAAEAPQVAYTHLFEDRGPGPLGGGSALFLRGWRTREQRGGGTDLPLEIVSRLEPTTGGEGRRALSIQITCRPGTVAAATVEALAESLVQAVRGLMSHCLSPVAGGVTPSTFPSAGLAQHELDRFLTKLTKKR